MVLIRQIGNGLIGCTGGKLWGSDLFVVTAGIQPADRNTDMNAGQW